MDKKKLLIGGLAGAALFAGIGSVNGLKKGLELGAKTGFLAGVTTGVVASTVCLFTKRAIKRKMASE